MASSSTECVEKLNGLLQGELSAVETYRQALDKVKDPMIKERLMECHMCHSGRVDTLTAKVKEFGGKIPENSGAWGAFAKMIEGGATAFGDKAAVAVLEEGEDKGLDDYKKLMGSSSPDVQAVASALISKQEATHAAMRDLKKTLSH